MEKKFRLAINIFFLLLIMVLWYTGNTKIWMIILLSSFLMIPFWGRLYCGYICPVFTSLNLWERYLGKFPASKKGKIFAGKRVQFGLFLIFLGIFVALNRFKISVPFFVLLIPLALIFAHFFGQGWWHRICPFGILFSLENRLFKKGFRIGLEKCVNCGLCVSSCPGMCIEAVDRKINYKPEFCLSCGECVQYCPGNKKVKGAVS